ncbi:MAG TPA: hypothetical protein VGI73_14480 [Solirubrobacterales bacterium]|jgi:hypothetical protein
MKRIMVRYTVKPEHAARNAELIKEVYEELDREQPQGLRYAAFVLDDGVTFMHIVVRDEEGSSLTEIAAFQRFREGLRDRCDVPPVSTELDEVGSYRFFD